MVSTRISSMAAAPGRGFGVGGRKGCRCLQSRTEKRRSGSHRSLQRTRSSTIMRRITRFINPYSVARDDRYAWWSMYDVNDKTALSDDSFLLPSVYVTKLVQKSLFAVVKS